MINPNEAPKGFTACAGEQDSCEGCAFRLVDCTVDGLNAYCCPEDRKDREHVIFVQRKPTVKLPQRMEDNAGRNITVDKNGRWMLAADVIAALKAAGVDFE